MSVDSITAIATIVAALIAAILSIVSLTLSKELKTSEFRQAWIDGLRDDLASFLSAARAFSRFMDAKRRLGDDYKSKVLFPISDEKLGDLRHVAALSMYKIKLRLNSDEGNQKKLLDLLDQAIVSQNKVLEEGKKISVLDAVDRVANQSQVVLKQEWERVKKGEKAFRILRNIVAPGIAVITIMLIIVVLINQRFDNAGKIPDSTTQDQRINK